MKKSIPECEEEELESAAEPEEVVDSFYSFTNDIKNRKQFTNLLKNSNSNPIIVYKGNEMETMAFIMQIRAEVKNDGDDFLRSLKLTQNNVFYNTEKTKIIKLIITQ